MGIQIKIIDRIALHCVSVMTLEELMCTVYYITLSFYYKPSGVYQFHAPTLLFVGHLLVSVKTKRLQQTK
jgi:hypothetical protein